MDRTRRNWLKAHMPRLFGYALGLTRDRSRAADLVQESCLKALSANAVPRDERAFRVWLFRILKNTLIDEIRRQRLNERLHDKISETGMEDFNAEERLISRLAVQRGLERLPPDHRHIIAMIDLAGLSYAEAAELLGVPKGTVMSRISRARASLLNLIEKDNVRVIPLETRERSRRAAKWSRLKS
jgi:RNA polymerase sigma-70 factor (ECF subfamily)